MPRIIVNVGSTAKPHDEIILASRLSLKRPTVQLFASTHFWARTNNP